ncbi:mannitol-1-phosphate 5-dehydrogenase [Clostridia bacterium]|nr:mannitol-1-phosphate 5-dehydrogenase [Clostridia bacterium]
MYGAGSIGRGFIGQLLSESGYEVVFIDVDAALVSRLNADGRYPLRLVGSGTDAELFVKNVRAVNGRDATAAAHEIATADIMATAVGANILPYIAPVIAQGLALRWESNNVIPLNILICENLIDANKALESLLLNHIDKHWHDAFPQCVGLVEVSVGRMVPVPSKLIQGDNPLRVLAEPYSLLPVDKDGIRGGIPDIKGLLPYSPFQFYIERKLYMHNMSHAVLSYLGAAAGHEFVWQAARDTSITRVTADALNEAAQGLSSKFNVPIGELDEFARDLLKRYDNPALGDTIGRVCRDPLRKLALEDRLIGAARMCLSQGIQPRNIMTGIGAALLYSHMHKEDV